MICSALLWKVQKAGRVRYRLAQQRLFQVEIAACGHLSKLGAHDQMTVSQSEGWHRSPLSPHPSSLCYNICIKEMRTVPQIKYNQSYPNCCRRNNALLQAADTRYCYLTIRHQQNESGRRSSQPMPSLWSHLMVSRQPVISTGRRVSRLPVTGKLVVCL